MADPSEPDFAMSVEVLFVLRIESEAGVMFVPMPTLPPFGFRRMSPYALPPEFQFCIFRYVLPEEAP
jgi:hypothetical protein